MIDIFHGGEGGNKEGGSVFSANSVKPKILHIAFLNRSCPVHALFMTLNVKTSDKSCIKNDLSVLLSVVSILSTVLSNVTSLQLCDGLYF